MNYRPISYPLALAGIASLIYGVMIAPGPVTGVSFSLPTLAMFLVGFNLVMGAMIAWMTGEKPSEQSPVDHGIYAIDEWENHSSRKPYNPPKQPRTPSPPPSPSIPCCAISRAKALSNVAPIIRSMAQRLELDKVVHDEFLPDRTYVDHRKVDDVVSAWENHIVRVYNEAYGGLGEDLPDWLTEDISEAPAFLQFNDAGVQLCT